MSPVRILGRVLCRENREQRALRINGLGMAEEEESQPRWSGLMEGGMLGHEAGGWGGCIVCRTGFYYE